MSPARRIMEEITVRMRPGEWPPGTRLPVETELAAQNGCARGPANKAMTALAEAGLVERRRKGGSFVARPPVHSAVLDIPDIAQLITARGEIYAFVLLSRRLRLSADGPETALKSSDPVLALEGVHRAGDAPFAYETRILNLAAAPDAEKVDFSHTAPGSWLLTHIPWTEARHRITSVGADRTAARRLEIRIGTPCLQLERWTWRAGVGVTYARQTYPGDRYDLVADFAPH